MREIEEGMAVELGEFSLDRMVRAVEKVRERLLRAAGALERAGIAYAVAGGNAVALWVSRVDEAAVRNTRDVDILIRRSDLDATKAALTSAGFVYRHSSGLDLFLDGPEAAARDVVHVVFALEKVRPHEALANPDVTDAESTTEFRVLSLPALVRIKLTAYRDKDRTHLRDLIDVGLIDENWYERLPDELSERLRQLTETPEG
jgi:predicted nucleotidyltransferase